MNSRPDAQGALEKYRRLAGTYDQLVRPARGVRSRAIERLDLKPGDIVLDVACGTGLSFSLLEERIGRQGTLIGIDMSPEMLEKARARVAEAGWANVQLIEAAIEDVKIPGKADAALFHFTHDVLRTPAALRTVLGHLGPGARTRRLRLGRSRATAGSPQFPRW